MTGPLIRPGDPWPEHYRGSTYHFNDRGEVWFQITYHEDPKDGWDVPNDIRIYAKDGHQEIVKDLLRIKQGGGFRITETYDIITKREGDGENMEAIYVAEMPAPIIFEHVDVLGTDLKPMDLWTSFYTGAKYSFVGDHVWWYNYERSLRQKAEHDMPRDIMRTLQRLKPQGGSFRVTENGKVIALIPQQPMYSTRIQEQYEALTPAQATLFAIKVHSTKMLPVYIGEYHDGFTLLEARKITDPLSPKALSDLAKFLKNYGQDVTDASPDVIPDDDLPEGLV